MPIIKKVYMHRNWQEIEVRPNNWNWDLSKASTSRKTTKQMDTPWSNSSWYSMAFNNDWTKLLCCSSAQWWWYIYTFTLSTPYDISTATYSNRVRFSQEYINLSISKDWTKLFWQLNTANWINWFSLATPFDITSTMTSLWNYTIGDATLLDMSADWRTFVPAFSNRNLSYSTSSTPWTVNTSFTSVINSSTQNQFIAWRFSNDWKYLYTIYTVSNSFTVSKYQLASPYTLAWMNTTPVQTFTDTWWSCWWICFDKSWNNMYLHYTTNHSYWYQYIVQYPLT